MFNKDIVKKGKDIAEFLGDFNKHGSHGKPFNYDVVKDLGLKVSLLEDNQDLQEKVLSVYHATMATFELTNCVKIIENHKGVGTYLIVR